MSAPRPDPKPPRFTAGSVAGCYDFAFARWWFSPAGEAESPVAFLPQRLLLDTTPALYGSRFRRVRAAPGVTKVAARDSRAAWEMIGDDSIGLAWKESAGEVNLRMAIEADSLRGLAHAPGESPDPLYQPRTIAVATRVPCESDQRAPRVVVATWTDSLAAFLQAKADADRIRRGITFVNAQHVHDMISRFRTVRGHIPEKLEELMSIEYIRKPDGLWLRDGWGRPFTYFVGPRNYELRSAGADGVAGNADDVVTKRPTR